VLFGIIHNRAILSYKLAIYPALAGLAHHVKYILRLACKPHSVQHRHSSLRPWVSSWHLCLGGHLSVQPTRDWWRGEQPLVPAWPYSRRGLPGRPHCCGRRWSLTPPFHCDDLRPFPPPIRGRAGRGSRPVSVALSGRLLRPGVSPASCSVECGLSSTLHRSAKSRPPGQPEDKGIIPSPGL